MAGAQFRPFSIIVGVRRLAWDSLMLFSSLRLSSSCFGENCETMTPAQAVMLLLLGGCIALLAYAVIAP